MVLLIGATRGTGLLIARLLEREGRTIRVLARDAVRARGLFSSGVDVVPGYITKKETLLGAISGATHIVFTAGQRSGRPVREAKVKETEYKGVLNTLAAARDVGFSGRFMYMTSSGVGGRSIWTWMLNTYKGNTLHWRLRAEEAIRASGADYTVIRAGVLLNRPGGKHSIVITQEDLPLSPRYHVARADVAAVFVAALDHPRARRATFEVVWGRGQRADWHALLDLLQPDEAPA